MDDTAELIELEELVQAERPPENTREVFLNPPDWRYITACEYLEEERCGRTPTVPTDPMVLFTIRALRAYRNPTNRALMFTLWNDVAEVLRLGISYRKSAIVAEIESHLIAGHTAENLKEMHACHIPPMLYELYNKIFFDLSGITAVHSWIHTFLFAPERHSSDQTLLRARLLAYYASADKGVNTAVFGSPDASAAERAARKVRTDASEKTE